MKREREEIEKVSMGMGFAGFVDERVRAAASNSNVSSCSLRGGLVIGTTAGDNKALPSRTF
jgi:hypothetical protein